MSCSLALMKARLEKWARTVLCPKGGGLEWKYSRSKAGPALINSRESSPGAAGGTQPSLGQQCPGVQMSPQHLDWANPEHSWDFSPISLGLKAVEAPPQPLQQNLGQHHPLGTPG